MFNVQTYLNPNKAMSHEDDGTHSLRNTTNMTELTWLYGKAVWTGWDREAMSEALMVIDSDSDNEKKKAVGSIIKGISRYSYEWYPLLGSFPYHSHTTPINSLGAPGNSLDVSNKITVMTPVNVKHQPDFVGESISSWYL